MRRQESNLRRRRSERRVPTNRNDSAAHWSPRNARRPTCREQPGTTIKGPAIEDPGSSPGPYGVEVCPGKIRQQGPAEAAREGIEPSNKVINSHLPVPAQDLAKEAVSVAGFEPAISCARGTRSTRLSHTLLRRLRRRGRGPFTTGVVTIPPDSGLWGETGIVRHVALTKRQTEGPLGAASSPLDDRRRGSGIGRIRTVSDPGKNRACCREHLNPRRGL